MADLNNITPMKGLPPFLQYFRTIGIIPASYKVTMTFEEQVLELMRFIKEEIIPKINENVLATQELQEKFKELVTYVDEYFENLDVQTEVNTKLNEMATDGTLAEIINQEIFENLNEAINQNAEDIEILNNKIDNIQQNETNISKTEIQNLMIYDNPTNALGGFQGSCIDDYNVIYSYNIKDNVYGDLLKFNSQTKEFLGKIENLSLYHCNDMVYNEGFIYSADCYDANMNFSKLIHRIQLSNNTVDTINPFDNLSQYKSIFGLAKIDSTHILCALNNPSSTYEGKFEKIGLFKLDLTNLTYEEISITNTKNLQVNFWSVFQNIEIIDDKLFMLVCGSSAILEFIFENDSYNLNKIHTLPETNDTLGLRIGEFESICKFKNNQFGKNTLLLTSSVGYYNVNYFTQMFYLCNLFYGIAETPEPTLYTDYRIKGNRQVIHVDNSSTSLYENGTTEFPFKQLNRAIDFLNLSSYFAGKTGFISIDDGDNYNLFTISNKKCDIFNGASKNINIYTGDGFGITNNSDVVFNTYGEYKFRLNINRINIEFSKVNFFYCDIICQEALSDSTQAILCGRGSIVKFHDGTFNISNNCKHGLQIIDNLLCIINFASIANKVQTEWCQIYGNSIVQVKNTHALNEFDKSGSATLIKAGQNIGF